MYMPPLHPSVVIRVVNAVLLQLKDDEPITVLFIHSKMKKDPYVMLGYPILNPHYLSNTTGEGGRYPQERSSYLQTLPIRGLPHASKVGNLFSNIQNTTALLVVLSSSSLFY